MIRHHHAGCHSCWPALDFACTSRWSDAIQTGATQQTPHKCCCCERQHHNNRFSKARPRITGGPIECQHSMASVVVTHLGRWVLCALTNCALPTWAGVQRYSDRPTWTSHGIFPSHIPSTANGAESEKWSTGAAFNDLDSRKSRHLWVWQPL